MSASRRTNQSGEVQRRRMHNSLKLRRKSERERERERMSLLFARPSCSRKIYTAPRGCRMGRPGLMPVCTPSRVPSLSSSVVSHL